MYSESDIEQVRIYGDPALRKKAEDIIEFNEELRDIAERMIDTMYMNNGIGLAGPQVGLSMRISVIDRSLGDDVNDVIAIINPEILEKSGEVSLEEGCLSIPGIYEEVLRPENIFVRFQDLDGVVQEIEADGMFARVIQHEMDHLKGILFVDRLGSIKRKMLSKKLRSLSEEGVIE